MARVGFERRLDRSLLRRSYPIEHAADLESVIVSALYCYNDDQVMHNEQNGFFTIYSISGNVLFCFFIELTMEANCECSKRVIRSISETL